MDVKLRLADPSDAEAIGRLHAESWRSAYRGMFPDAFLDGAVFEDRQRQWIRRLRTEPSRERRIWVAEADGHLVGFLCVCLDEDPAWGPLLDNLHIAPDRKGCGIGKRLIDMARSWVQAQGPCEQWHLWVLEDNHPTRRVYEHLGWVPVDRALKQAPDGAAFYAWRYVQRLD